jgi:hypothetical protein
LGYSVRMDKLKSHVGIVVLSAAGMLLGHWLGAQLAWIAPSVQAQPAPGTGAVSTRALEVVGADGRRQIVMGTSGEGSPGIWIFDKNGKVRLSIGLYGDNNASIVLNDESERAVQIFRTVGAGSAPVLVMKSDGRDRIVMGLGGLKLDPFFVYYDAAGVKQSVFGSF